MFSLVTVIEIAAFISFLHTFDPSKVAVYGGILVSE